MATLGTSLYRKKWFVTAGKSRLSQGFASQELAEEALSNNRGFYEYWAGSAGTSLENTPPKTVQI